MCKLYHAPSDPPGVAQNLVGFELQAPGKRQMVSHATSDLARCGSESAGSELQAFGKGTEVRFVNVQTFSCTI